MDSTSLLRNVKGVHGTRVRAIEMTILGASTEERLVVLAAATQTDGVVYPDSDGLPISDNTRQFRWITTIHHNLAWEFAQAEQVFVAGDLLWYPVQGSSAIRQAPDVMVVFGVPKGDRGSYRQWQENHVAPQVVFEILSPGNTLTEMNKKFGFYDRYGVEEYYLYDPDKNDLGGWLRLGDRSDSKLGSPPAGYPLCPDGHHLGNLSTQWGAVRRLCGGATTGDRGGTTGPSGRDTVAAGKTAIGTAGPGVAGGGNRFAGLGLDVLAST
jgi:Uma2 family endonuclease